ncbi:MAG: PEGA domain-containing protein [Nitrospira sp.]|nr:PEGA domain-containing protein [Nitrospira sp.]
MNGPRCVLAIGIVVAGWMATGCATVANGPNQDLTVTSQPEALCVKINGDSYGATPVVASLPRGKTYVVEVAKDRYHPYQLTVVPTASGMIWGNLLFGGLIGMAVDSTSGAGYNHSPDRVHAYFAVPIQEDSPRPVCPESILVLEARRKAAEKLVYVKSGLTPYEQPMGH